MLPTCQPNSSIIQLQLHSWNERLLDKIEIYLDEIKTPGLIQIIDDAVV